MSDDQPPGLADIIALARQAPTFAQFAALLDTSRAGSSYRPGSLSDAIALRQSSSSLASYDQEAVAEWFGRYGDARYRTRPPAGDTLTVYRATPDGLPIRPGDYVTESRAYAATHLHNQLEGLGKIVAAEVALDDLYPADGPHEFWYAPRVLDQYPSLAAFYEECRATRKAVPIHELTLAQFLDGAKVDPSIEVPDDEFCSVMPSAILASSIHSIAELTGGLLEPDGDYAVAHLKNGRDAVLLHQEHEFDDWEVVGQYVGDSLNLVPTARGQGLGAALVVTTALLRDGKTGAKEFTADGERCHRNAHRLAVQMALLQNEMVPAEVLSDYPDLATNSLQT